MTNYEYLMDKSDKCTQAALKASDPEARDIWRGKAEALQKKALLLSIAEAEEVRR